MSEFVIRLPFTLEDVIFGPRIERADEQPHPHCHSVRHCRHRDGRGRCTACDGLVSPLTEDGHCDLYEPTGGAQ